MQLPILFTTFEGWCTISCKPLFSFSSIFLLSNEGILHSSSDSPTSYKYNRSRVSLLSFLAGPLNLKTV